MVQCRHCNNEPREVDCLCYWEVNAMLIASAKIPGFTSFRKNGWWFWQDSGYISGLGTTLRKLIFTRIKFHRFREKALIYKNKTSRKICETAIRENLSLRKNPTRMTMLLTTITTSTKYFGINLFSPIFMKEHLRRSYTLFNSVPTSLLPFGAFFATFFFIG